jgi:hypothetical protein
MAVQKLVLQEGEKFVLLLTNTSLSNQGLFAIVSNLGRLRLPKMKMNEKYNDDIYFSGSLVARFVFQPIEEVSYNVFSQLHSVEKSENESGKEPRRKNDQKEMMESLSLLKVLVKLLILVGMK